MTLTPYPERSDIELCQLLKEGDRDAYTEIYERYKGLLYVHAYKMLQDSDSAEDVVQELFTRLWVKRAQLHLQRTLSAYLYTSIRNQVLDRIARQKVESRYVESLQNFMQSAPCLTDHRVRERELQTRIEKEVSTLPSKMRRVFEMSRKAYLSHKEIAEELKISEKTVKKQINNALKVLRVRLGEAVVLFCVFSQYWL